MNAAILPMAPDFIGELPWSGASVRKLFQFLNTHTWIILSALVVDLGTILGFWYWSSSGEGDGELGKLLFFGTYIPGAMVPILIQKTFEWLDRTITVAAYIQEICIQVGLVLGFILWGNTDPVIINLGIGLYFSTSVLLGSLPRLKKFFVRGERTRVAAFDIIADIGGNIGLVLWCFSDPFIFQLGLWIYFAAYIPFSVIPRSMSNMQPLIKHSSVYLDRWMNQTIYSMNCATGFAV